MAPLKIPSDIPLSASAACGRRLALVRVAEWLVTDADAPCDSLFRYPKSRSRCVNDSTAGERRRRLIYLQVIGRLRTVLVWDSFLIEEQRSRLPRRRVAAGNYSAAR